MTARMWIAGGLGVWLASIVYGILLLNSPLPFMAPISIFLIRVCFGLPILSLVMFSIGIRRHRGFSAIRTLPLLVLYLVFVLAAGTICLFAVPFIFHLITRMMTLFGLSTLSFVQAYCQMRYVPLWSWMGFSAGLPLGTWALCAWMRRTHLWRVVMPDNSASKSANEAQHD